MTSNFISYPDPPRGRSDARAMGMYLDLLKGVLTRSISPERYRGLDSSRAIRRLLARTLKFLVGLVGLEVVRPVVFDPAVREHGLDWPPDAETMVGLRRLDNIQFCVEDILRRSVPGDLIETGVWRGGSTIFMRAILKVHEVEDRVVWVADSFQGLPRPNDRYPQDAGDLHYTQARLRVTVADVRENFKRYGLLDDQVKFLVGWFAESLPAAPIQKLCLLRLDGDMYASTMDALRALYDKVSAGGYVIVDDYGLEGCRKAIDDFRAERGIPDSFQMIDNSGAVFWKKSSG
jgi:O-methyltransferase